MSIPTKKEASYERLRKSVQSSTGVLLPEYSYRSSRSIKVFLTEFARENIEVGKGIMERQVKSVTPKKQSKEEDYETLRKALADIVKGINVRSINEISHDLKKLNKLVNY